MTEDKAVERKALSADAIAEALKSPDENKGKKDAREAVRSMTGTWEHLPVRIRSAVRTDIGRMLVAGKSKAEIMEAGYSAITAERALRDLGLAG